jgi:hypothetical protein
MGHEDSCRPLYNTTDDVLAMQGPDMWSPPTQNHEMGGCSGNERLGIADCIVWISGAQRADCAATVEGCLEALGRAGVLNVPARFTTKMARLWIYLPKFEVDTSLTSLISSDAIAESPSSSSSLPPKCLMAGMFV